MSCIVTQNWILKILGLPKDESTCSYFLGSQSISTLYNLKIEEINQQCFHGKGIRYRFIVLGVAGHLLEDVQARSVNIRLDLGTQARVTTQLPIGSKCWTPHQMRSALSPGAALLHFQEGSAQWVSVCLAFST